MIQEKARRKLLDFTLYTYPGYRVNWHHRLICAALDDWLATPNARLMLFTPPRHGKSELVSRRLPAFILGNDRDAKVVGASYGLPLARLMNRDVQRIIQDPLYSDLFPHTRLFGRNIRAMGGETYLKNADMFEVVGYRGHYRAAGVRSALTGMGMTHGIIDDPVKDKLDAKSPVIREAIWEWYKTVFRTRMAKNARILLTMTRWHLGDLAGKLVDLAHQNPKADQWRIIKFPAVKEGEPGDIDPRPEGEPLWPDEYDDRYMESTKATTDPDEWLSIYQQSPTDPAGAIFKREWWNQPGTRYQIGDKEIKNRVIGRWISFDTAMKDKEENDYTGMVVAELWPDYRLGIRLVSEERLEFPDLTGRIEHMARRWDYDEKLKGILIEDRQSGTSALQTLRKSMEARLAELLIGFIPTTSKRERANQSALWCRLGCVLLPVPDLSGTEWIGMFEDQLFDFPGATHDDMVDAFTQLVIYLENYLSTGYFARENEPAEIQGD